MTNPNCACGHDHDDKKEDDCCGDGCGCGHDHDHGHVPTISPEDLEKLKQAITDAGYKIEETPEGEIRILEK